MLNIISSAKQSSMADLADTFGLAGRAIAWNGDIAQLDQLCNNISTAAFDRKEYAAVRIAATILLKEPRLPALHRAQVLLYLVSFTEDDIGAAERLPEAETIIEKLENVSDTYGLNDPRLAKLRNQAAKFRDYFARSTHAPTSVDFHPTPAFAPASRLLNQLSSEQTLQEMINPSSSVPSVVVQEAKATSLPSKGAQEMIDPSLSAPPGVVQEDHSTSLPLKHSAIELASKDSELRLPSMPKRQSYSSVVTSSPAETAYNANRPGSVSGQRPSRIPSIVGNSPQTAKQAYKLDWLGPNNNTPPMVSRMRKTKSVANLRSPDQ